MDVACETLGQILSVLTAVDDGSASIGVCECQVGPHACALLGFLAAKAGLLWRFG